MLKVRITAIRQTVYNDLIAQYEILSSMRVTFNKGSNGYPLTALVRMDYVLLPGIQ